MSDNQFKLRSSLGKPKSKKADSFSWSTKPLQAVQLILTQIAFAAYHGTFPLICYC